MPGRSNCLHRRRAASALLFSQPRRPGVSASRPQMLHSPDTIQLSRPSRCYRAFRSRHERGPATSSSTGAIAAGCSASSFAAAAFAAACSRTRNSACCRRTCSAQLSQAHFTHRPASAHPVRCRRLFYARHSHHESAAPMVRRRRRQALQIIRPRGHNELESLDHVQRPQAVTFSIGNIAETSLERQHFWQSLEPAMMNRLGSISLPQNLPSTASRGRSRMAAESQPDTPCHVSRQAPIRIPLRSHPRSMDAKRRPGSFPQQQPGNTCFQPESARVRHAAPRCRDASSWSFPTMSPTLPASKFSPTGWRRTWTSTTRSTTPSSTSRRRANDKRNWHAHIAAGHYDVPRKPGSKYPDPDAIQRPLAVNKFSAISCTRSAASETTPTTWNPNCNLRSRSASAP